VEDNILKILRQRKLDCYLFHHYAEDQKKYCQKLTDEYSTAEANWYAKCKQICSIFIAQPQHT